MKSLWFKSSLLCCFLLAHMTVALASTTNTQMKSLQFEEDQTWPVSDQNGVPSTDGGGGGRGDCLRTEIPMMAVIAPNHVSDNYPGLGQTVSPTPSIWIYVPYAADEVTMGKFVIQDQDGEQNLWETEFTLPEQTPGFVKVSLPTTLTSSANWQTGKPYIWYFDLNCPRATESTTPITPASVNGWISPITLESNLISQLQTAQSTEQKMQIYRSADLWYDWVETAVQEGENSEAWRLVLQSSFRDSEHFSVLENAPIAGSVITSSPPN